MSLFRINQAGTQIFASAEMVTSCGVFEVGLLGVNELGTQRTLSYGDGVVRIAQSNSQVEVEYIVGHLPTLVANGLLKVDGCVAVVGRYKCICDDIRVAAYCKWKEMPDRVSGGSDSGEHLDAQTWDIDGYRISLGTEDEEIRSHRVEADSQLDMQVWSDVNGTGSCYLRNGFVTPMPRIKRGNVFQFHYVVGWKALPVESEDVSTWFAVDQKAQGILDHFKVT